MSSVALERQTDRQTDIRVYEVLSSLAVKLRVMRKDRVVAVVG